MDVDYTLSAALIRQIKQVLDQIPGTPVRLLHNAIDAEVERQNQERRELMRVAEPAP